MNRPKRIVRQLRGGPATGATRELPHTIENREIKYLRVRVEGDDDCFIYRLADGAVEGDTEIQFFDFQEAMTAEKADEYIKRDSSHLRN